MKEDFNKVKKQLDKLGVEYEVTKNNRIVIDKEWSSSNLCVSTKEDSDIWKNTEAGEKFFKIYDKLENEWADDSGVNGGGYYIITEFETILFEGEQVTPLICGIAQNLAYEGIDYRIVEFDEIEISMFEDIENVLIGSATTELFQEQGTVSIIDN